MKENKAIEHKDEQSSSGGFSFWKLIGGVALAMGVAAVVVSLPDIKRYVKISTM